jgi:pimeloyl-ACP methyl ester carboxylesterase
MTMQWRRLLMSGGAALGGAAAYNVLARRGAPALGAPFEGDEGWMEWRGHRLAHRVRGSGPPLLLLHSIGLWSWSLEWREVAPALAENYTVHTLDLLGFGRSDRPRVPYSARLYLALIADFARRVVGTPVALVGAGLSGAYAAELAASDPARFPIVALVAPTGLARLRERPTTMDDAGRRLVDSPIIGTAAWNARVSRAALRTALRASYYRDARVDDELLAAALATTHQPGAKHAPSAWLANQLNLDIRPALQRLIQPTMLLWGAQAELNPAEESFGYRALKRDVSTSILDGAGDFPQLERAEESARLIGAFLASA